MVALGAHMTAGIARGTHKNQIWFTWLVRLKGWGGIDSIHCVIMCRTPMTGQSCMRHIWYNPNLWNFTISQI